MPRTLLRLSLLFTVSLRSSVEEIEVARKDAKLSWYLDSLDRCFPLFPVACPCAALVPTVKYSTLLRICAEVLSLGSHLSRRVS